jgi:hypothetical protein
MKRESDADRLYRNDKSLTCVAIGYWGNVIAILDALKNNSVVKEVSFQNPLNLLQVNHEAFVKLLDEVMKCNKTVTSLTIFLDTGILDNINQVFAAMGTSDGWSSIKELVLVTINKYNIKPLSLREAEQISSFIVQSENLHTLSLDIAGVDLVPILETLSRIEVQSLKIHFDLPSTFSLQSGVRQLTTALERCTCITELRLEFPSCNGQVEFFQILVVESIQKMLGLKKFELEIHLFDQHFFDIVGQCIGRHQGEIEELRLICFPNSSSIVGLAPALRRLKVTHFDSGSHLTSQQMVELSGIVADCDTLQEFGYNLTKSLHRMSPDDFKAICQLWSKFPSLKRVKQGNLRGEVCIDLREETRFLTFLGMVQTARPLNKSPRSSAATLKMKLP